MIKKPFSILKDNRGNNENDNFQHSPYIVPDQNYNNIHSCAEQGTSLLGNKIAQTSADSLNSGQPENLSLKSAQSGSEVYGQSSELIESADYDTLYRIYNILNSITQSEVNIKSIVKYLLSYVEQNIDFFKTYDPSNYKRNKKT